MSRAMQTARTESGAGRLAGLVDGLAGVHRVLGELPVAVAVRLEFGALLAGGHAAPPSTDRGLGASGGVAPPHWSSS